MTRKRRIINPTEHTYVQVEDDRQGKGVSRVKDLLVGGNKLQSILTIRLNATSITGYTQENFSDLEVKNITWFDAGSSALLSIFFNKHWYNEMYETHYVIPTITVLSSPLAAYPFGTGESMSVSATKNSGTILRLFIYKV